MNSNLLVKEFHLMLKGKSKGMLNKEEPYQLPGVKERKEGL